MNTMPKMHTCFNTQPPEGGWARALACNAFRVLFQHTAARRRLGARVGLQCFQSTVSTHSRPKAAGPNVEFIELDKLVSTHSRPKAAGGENFCQLYEPDVSTHSRPKAAGHQF